MSFIAIYNLQLNLGNVEKEAQRNEAKIIYNTRKDDENQKEVMLERLRHGVNTKKESEPQAYDPFQYTF